LVGRESAEGGSTGSRRGFFFLVTLLAVVMVALPMLHTGSSVYSDQDTSPPDTQITAGPSGTVDYADVTFSWTGWDDINPASQLEYSFNLQGYETGWSDWASATTKDYANLRGGSYIFKVKARDQAGNADPTPAETAFYVSWSFAVLTDLHIGREFSDYDGPGWNDSGTPVSGEAAGHAQDAVNEINKLTDSQNIAFVAVLGDITDQAELSELRAAKLIFDNLTVPWVPIIGNHDGWPMTDNDEAPDCCPPPDSYFDSIMGPEYSNLASEMSGWGKESPALVYNPERERDAYFENFFFDYGGFHFVCLDLNRDGWRAGELHDFAGGTWSWFKQHMEQFVQQNPERSRDVILLAHHPMRDDGLSGESTFTAAELDQISNFTVNTSYSYVDSSGITQTRPYSSRIWGQLAGHTHPFRLEVDYPAWSNGGPVITYPRNFGSVQMSVVRVTSDTPSGVDYSRPTVATEAATSISPISATLNGYVASLGTAASVQVSFEWGLTTDYSNATTSQTGKTGFFTFPISGLAPETIYHFRAKAVGDGDAVYGSDMTFTTGTISPKATTGAATDIATTSATLNGTLDDLGTASSVIVSFEWGTTASGPYPNRTLNQTMTGTGIFSDNLTGLGPGTTCYYRAKAVGEATGYGNEKSFTTLSTPPSVNTNDADTVATTSARLNGDLTALGTAVNVTVCFEWGTSKWFYTQTTDNQTLSAAGAFSANLTGLSPGTTCYYRAKAVGDGSNYGAEKSFTTGTTPPAVTTNDATSVTTNSARLNGTLTSLGTASNVTVSFEWGTTSSYGAETGSQSMTITGNFGFDLTGVSSNTTYHFRVKVVADGAVYGDDVVFTTVRGDDITAPAILTVRASDISFSSVTIEWTTNEPATGQVEYGLTEEYGSIATTDTGLLNNHSVELTGLEAGKTYHYRVISRDVSNNQAVSADETFTTTTHSGAKSTMAWPFIGLAALAQFGLAVYFRRADMVQEELVRELEEAVSRADLFGRERDEATATLQSMERALTELRNEISLFRSKAGATQRDVPAPDMSKGQVALDVPATSAPAGVKRA